MAFKKPFATIEQRAKSLNDLAEEFIQRHFPRSLDVQEAAALGFLLGTLHGSNMRDQTHETIMRTVFQTLKTRYGYSDDDVAMLIMIG